MAPTLPFAMLPLQVALDPTRSTPPGQRGGDGGGDAAGGVSSRESRGGGRTTGGAGRSTSGGGKLPLGVREKALLCLAAAIRGSGVLFVKVKPLLCVFGVSGFHVLLTALVRIFRFKSELCN